METIETVREWHWSIGTASIVSIRVKFCPFFGPRSLFSLPRARLHRPRRKSTRLCRHTHPETETATAALARRMFHVKHSLSFPADAPVFCRSKPRFSLIFSAVFYAAAPRFCRGCADAFAQISAFFKNKTSSLRSSVFSVFVSSFPHTTHFLLILPCFYSRFHNRNSPPLFPCFHFFADTFFKN